MLRSVVTLASALVLAASASSLAAASPAAAAAGSIAIPAYSDNGGCSIWTDGATFGMACTSLPGMTYTSVALCGDGTVQSGPSESGTSGKWTYAYCSGHSNMANGDPEFYHPPSLSVTRPPRIRAAAAQRAAVRVLISGHCKVWSDGATFGMACTGLSGYQYQSAAQCQDGSTATGPIEGGTSGRWSYAYCSSHGNIGGISEPAIF